MEAKAVKIYGVFICLMFFLLSLRLWQLQMLKGERFLEMSRRNAIRLISIPAPRGVIYDRRGAPLVTSRIVFRICLDVRDVKNPREEYELLARLLGLKSQDIARMVDSFKGSSHEPVVLVKDADAFVLSRVMEHKSQLPGISIMEYPTRQYVFGHMASHVIGYLGEIDEKELSEKRAAGYHMGDFVGKAGVERVYEGFLKGVDGGRQVEVNNLGTPIKDLGVKEPVSGCSIYLTIDQKLQAAAEKAFDEHLALLNRRGAPHAKAGAAIVMEPDTGKILAMVSKPDYNPNIFLTENLKWKIKTLSADRLLPFYNRAICGEYPYGSTFKMITGSAALEEGKVTASSRFYCSGYDPVYPRKRCWTVGKGIRHGTESIVEGFRNSCNIVFYALGRRLGPDTLAKYARAFGFGKHTGVELPGEHTGLVPTREWKRKTFHLPWYFPESMDFGIGQGYMNGTPIQLAAAYCALVNGGTLYKPQIVSKVISPDGHVIKLNKPAINGKIPISKKNIEIVRKGLAQVVAEGTARSAFAGFPIPAGGKTGTAECPPQDNHGWFVGYAPEGKPKIVVVVLVEEGKSGAQGAAPIGRKIMESYFGL